MIRPEHPACPPSAVSHGVGLAGLAGLGVWLAVARYHALDGPYAAIAALLACGVPMILWSLLVDGVHTHPDTGINWTQQKRMDQAARRSATKLLGLWATWGCIALVYLCGRWYWQGPYREAMGLLLAAVPALMFLSIPYVLWLERYLLNPHDGAYAFGQWLLGPRAGAPDFGALVDHLRGWAVKGFFLAFMLAILPGNFSHMVGWQADDLLTNPVNLAGFLIALMFTVDVVFATVGYILTLRPLNAHIRSANPLPDGWVAALACYPPFVLMGPGGPLFYEQDVRGWDHWLAGSPALLWLWGALLVALAGFYAWATVAFGLRFSNLTNRGILTHGPYRLCKHPAYLSKNLFWWLSVLPFLTVTDSIEAGLRNCAMLALVGAIYYWRARTEEAHLSADPAYRAYAGWIARHGMAARLRAGLAKRAAQVPTHLAE